MSETFAIQDRTEWRKKHRLFWGLATIRCSPNDRSANQGMCRRSTRLWQQLRKQSNNQQMPYLIKTIHSIKGVPLIDYCDWLIHLFQTPNLPTGSKIIFGFWMNFICRNLYGEVNAKLPNFFIFMDLPHRNQCYLPKWFYYFHSNYHLP